MRISEESSPFVSVIIPVYRNPDGLRICMDALQKQTYPVGRFEVIVIDNGGNGDIEPLISCCANARLLCEEIPGSYAARNTGLREARGDIIAFTDSDCIPAARWIAAGVDALDENPLVNLLSGQVDVFARNPEKPNLLETHQIVRGFHHERSVREEAFSGTANLLVYRELFEKIGPFREDLQSGADFEWTRRATSEGYLLAYDALTLVRHPARFVLRDFVLRYVRTTGGRYQQGLDGSLHRLTISSLLRYLVPPVRSTLGELPHHALGTPYRKLQFFIAEYLIQGIRLAETVRLALGGTPIRY